MPGRSLDNDPDAPSALDESKVQPGCNRSDLCSPYMRQFWAHDVRCPLSLGTKR